MPERLRRDIAASVMSRIERASLLGNHYKKNLRNIAVHLPLLLTRLEEKDVLSLITFDRISPFCVEEMELIRHVSRNAEEAFDLLGCYYSLQLISMNLNDLDLLEQQKTRVTNRTAEYKTVLLRAEAKFSILYCALIQTFLEILKKEEKDLPEFVICHVGARRDQDDIDVGIIHRAGGDLAALNRVIGRLNREMYRRATQMHFYLSEHSGSKWFSACIDVYEELMAVELKNLVIITQLFGAVPIAGSISLFEEFRERVVRRYTYRPGGDNRYYEGFMRGMVEEIRALVSHRTRKGEIVPKVDGLRLAKIIIAARRATLGIVGGHFWKVFKVLRNTDTLLQKEYSYLEEAIAFLELVRYLYHLIFVQEEGFYLQDPPSREALERIARYMGYEEKGKTRCSTALLRDYFRYAQRIKEISGIFKEEFKKYVQFIRIFRSLEHLGRLQDLQEAKINLATDYIDLMTRFHLRIPWGEFIGFLEEEEEGRERFFQDLMLLPSATMSRTLERYARSMARQGATFVRFLLCFFKSPARGEKGRLETALMSVFWKTLRRSPRRQEAILSALLEDEELFRDFVRSLTPEALRTLLLEIGTVRGHLRGRLRRQVFSLGFLYHYRSHLIARKMERLVRRGLLREETLIQTGELRSLSEKVLAALSSLPPSPPCYQGLRDYHDLETLRFALRCIETKRYARAIYMDRYVRRLAALALEEAGLIVPGRGPAGVGVYATGGNAAGEALNNDYDMFVICDPSRVSPSLVQKAVKRVHRELTRVGNLPHHRIAEKIGSFVISLDDLAAYLDAGYEEDYIERTELLGSRLMFGGVGLHRRFQKRIIRQRIFGRKRELIRSLARELREEHLFVDRELPALDLKQGRGGLFDLTLLFCLLKGHWEIYETSEIRSQKLLIRKDPVHAAAYDALFAAKRFLTDVRGVLRLTGFTERIEDAPDCLYPSLLKGGTTPETFFRRIERTMQGVQEISDTLIGELKG